MNLNADYNNEMVTLPNNADDQIDSLIDQVTGGANSNPDPTTAAPDLPEVTVTSSFMPTYAVLAVLGLIFLASNRKRR